MVRAQKDHRYSISKALKMKSLEQRNPSAMGHQNHQENFREKQQRTTK